MNMRVLVMCGTMALLTGSHLAASLPNKPSQRGEIPQPAGPKIKVLLEKDVPSAFLEARGPYRVIRKECGTSLSSGSSGKRFVVHALQDGLRWGEEYPDIYQISVVPLADHSSIFVNGIQYKGAVSVYHVRDCCITIVNEVPIEDYIKSTLAAQVDKALPEEAMKAVAITARTAAYSKALQGEVSPRPWDVAAKDVNYYGYGITQGKKGVEEAIDWTRYIVLDMGSKVQLPVAIQLEPDTASELAQGGMDVQKILKNQFPKAKFSATINADEVALR